jgi:hypothetical protein
LFLRLPVSGSSTLMECLNSYFRIIQFNAQPPYIQQISFVHFRASFS